MIQNRKAALVRGPHIPAYLFWGGAHSVCDGGMEKRGLEDIIPVVVVGEQNNEPPGVIMGFHGGV